MASIEDPAFAPISKGEIEWACSVMRLPADAFYGADGNDPRLAVMQSLETLDVEACPGSGKTTLLVAKLAILANRWKAKREGICVLSHTNAARDEIGERLSSTTAGHLLLRYPHFVGTIHSFVNEFLAIPWLISNERPIKAIDSNIALNDRWRRLPYGTRTYLERNHVTQSDLTYTCSDFRGGAKENLRASAGSVTYQNILKACRESTAAGYFCFDDMFVWASELLDRCPNLIGAVRRRFPLVFIDEVQDNSEVQSAFLYRLLMEGDGAVTRQRFGDSNQAIYSRSGAIGATTDAFPGISRADLPNSFRFGQTIADLASPLGVRPQQLVGRGPTTSCVRCDAGQSALFLFDDSSILGVLPAFAKHLVATFPPDTLARGHFVAVAGVHRTDNDDHPPRFIGHYAPDYDANIAGKQCKPATLAQHLARARLELATTRDAHPVTNRCAEGILDLVRRAGGDVPTSLRKSAHRYVLEHLTEAGIRKHYIDLVSSLLTSRCKVSKHAWVESLVPSILAIGKSIARREITEPLLSDFFSWSMGEEIEGTDSGNKTTNLFRYPQAGPMVSIRLGSIHSVKGETHTATLVLESYHKAHHLKQLIPWLTGKRPKPGTDNAAEKQTLIERLKLHYVAMTRPSHLLCLAMRADALNTKDREAIESRNWRIIECVAPA